MNPIGTSNRLGQRELGELRSERLTANVGEADRELHVVGQRLDREDGPHPKRRVAHARARTDTDDRLVLVFVRITVVRLNLCVGLRPAPASTRPPERRGHPRRGGEDRLHHVHQLRWDLTEKARGLRGLIFAKDAAASCARQNETCLRSRHPDIAEATLLLDRLVVVVRAHVGEEPLLHPDHEHDRKLKSLRGVQGHQPDPRFRSSTGVVLVCLREQGQPVNEWPASFALARAYMDQIERSGQFSAGDLAQGRQMLDQAEAASGAARRQMLMSLADAIAQRANGDQAAKVTMLAQAVRDLAMAG